jgi:hypothetical protein
MSPRKSKNPHSANAAVVVAVVKLAVVAPSVV